MSNSLRERRLRRGWTQAVLAEQARISRTAVSAVEAGRLVPSVAAALALAQSLECSVEQLFGEPRPDVSPDWAWPASRQPGRYWLAEVGGDVRAYPFEASSRGEVPHDGVGEPALGTASARFSPRDTLVVAGCDPAASLLAAEYERGGRFRMLSLQRASRRALELLASGLIHVAGVHLSSSADAEGNAAVVTRELGSGYRLLRLTDWEAGIAFRSGGKARTVQSLLSPGVNWVGREPGSGARQCLDELFGASPRFQFTAGDHRGVAGAIQGGWADAGVCPRLVSEEGNLDFLSLRWETYHLCFPAALEDDPRLRALVQAVRDVNFRRLLGELPGYDTKTMGELSGT